MKIDRRRALALLGLGAAAPATHAAAQSVGAVSFRHGVASGDPQQDRVILWTRITPEVPGGPVSYSWSLTPVDRRAGGAKKGTGLTGPERDYTVKVQNETRPHPEGAVYFSQWKVANDLGPAEKPGITRVKVTEGSWLLEPASGGAQTKATYIIFSDSGGGIPAFILNTAGKSAIAKIFTAVRTQVKLPKYSK